MNRSVFGRLAPENRANSLNSPPRFWGRGRGWGLNSCRVTAYCLPTFKCGATVYQNHSAKVLGALKLEQVSTPTHTDVYVEPGLLTTESEILSLIVAVRGGGWWLGLGLCLEAL